MRILLAALLVVFTALIGAPVRAADLPQYPDIQVPEVDYGLQGGFYLRGSAAANLLWTQEHLDICGCSVPPTAPGYGYSLGAGVGYEVGNGLRFDGTVDYLQNDGLTDGTNTLHLRGAVMLANAYYDFPLSGGAAAGGGWGAYVGAGAGATYYQVSVTPANVAVPDGQGWTPTVAAMAGVSYDAGSWVADLGYRMLYMPKISNYATSPDVPWYIYDNTVHEIRGTVRYRFQ
ncbi:MAG TPA: outer membrane beta-barrel protein [Devosia sp.]|nr:outer membrane beta-barrel protein [Devosia sp.]